MKQLSIKITLRSPTRWPHPLAAVSRLARRVSWRHQPLPPQGRPRPALRVPRPLRLAHCRGLPPPPPRLLRQRRPHRLLLQRDTIRGPLASVRGGVDPCVVLYTCGVFFSSELCLWSFPLLRARPSLRRGVSSTPARPAHNSTCRPIDGKGCALWQTAHILPTQGVTTTPKTTPTHQQGQQQQ